MTALITLASYSWVATKAEGVLPLDLSLKGSTPLLAAGPLIGVIVATLPVGVGAMFGARYKFLNQPELWTILQCLAVSIFAACTEEVAFRGVAFRRFQVRFGTPGAALIQGVLFVLAHNPSLGAIEKVNLFLASQLLIATVIATGSLWTSIGIHLTWNLVQTMFWGVAFADLRTASWLAQTRAPELSEALLRTISIGCATLVAWVIAARRLRAKHSVRSGFMRGAKLQQVCVVESPPIQRSEHL